MVISMQEILVDKFDSETSTVYQFYGFKWHGCLCIANDGAECRYRPTVTIENQMQSLGDNVVSAWECSHPESLSKELGREFIPYPHYIVYNCEVVSAKKDLSVASNLTINSSHIPISVAINDSLNQEPIFLDNQDPEQLIKEFIAELVRC